MDLVKGILKETVSDQALSIADWSPLAFKRGLTMQTNDYSGGDAIPDDKESAELNIGDALHALSQLHLSLADHFTSNGQTGRGRWHRQISQRLSK